MSGWTGARTVDVRGLAYGVRTLPAPDSGQRAVVLLHGFAGSAEDWTDAALAVANAGHDAIGIDLPGHGATGIPRDPGRFTMDETVRDLEALVEALGLASAHWVGYSMGARVALQLAIMFPERALSLTLESGSPGISDSKERDERRAQDEAFAAAIESRGVAWFVDRWEELPVFESQRRLPDAIHAAQRTRRLANRPEGIAGSLRGIGQGTRYLGDRLGGLRVPTLLLAGALDVKYATLAAGMAASIPDSEVVLIPGAGHNIHLEEPRAFQRAVIDRLRRAESAPRMPASLPA